MTSFFFVLKTPLKIHTNFSPGKHANLFWKRHLKFTLIFCTPPLSPCTPPLSPITVFLPLTYDTKFSDFRFWRSLIDARVKGRPEFCVWILKKNHDFFFIGGKKKEMCLTSHKWIFSRRCDDDSPTLLHLEIDANELDIATKLRQDLLFCVCLSHQK